MSMAEENMNRNCMTTCLTDLLLKKTFNVQPGDQDNCGFTLIRKG